MPRTAPFQNVLSIRWDSKAVPYGRTEERPDGSANYGFKDLKGNLDLVDSIPELAEDKDLHSLISAISQPRCGLFTVGCLSADVDEAPGFRKTGYVEIAINSKRCVEDARNYFPLYFHFDKHMHDVHFDKLVQFNWELQPAMFAPADVGGFTCAITINTHFYPSLHEASGAWVAALGSLEDCLPNYPVQAQDAIFGGI